MIKRLILLYHSEKSKENLFQYERVVRALLRKFRKSPLFSFLQIDTSSSCRDKMCDLIHAETSRRGAVFFESDAQSIWECMNLLGYAFNIHSSSHHISGRTICYPEQILETTDDDNIISCTSICKKENLHKALEVSVNAAKAQKHTLSLCLADTGEVDRIILHEAEVLLGKEKHIQSDFIPLDEMILLCTKTIPSFDVVLTTKFYATLIAMNLNSMPEIPSGYIVSNGEKCKIYRRQILPGEEVGNLHHYSSLMALAAIFENEFEMKSAANWFRRALSLALLKESSSPSTDFISAVIKEIEAPIRKRRTE